MAIKAIINNTEKEIEQIKNSDEQDIDYVYSRIGDTEVEGELPISIKSIGGELANYRIYGNTVSGESVGDLIESGEHAGEYKVPVTVEGKNLAKNNHSDSSALFTVEEVNNFIHVSGTNNSGSTTAVVISAGNSFPVGKYDIVNNSNTAIMYDYKNENNVLVSANVNANSIKTINFPAVFTRKLNVFISVSNGNSIDDYFQVMIVKHGDDTDTYEPYHAPVTAPIYLPEQIKKVGNELEYISYTDQKQHRVRKNELKNAAASQSINGLTFMVNTDKSITVNGTATEITKLFLGGVRLIKNVPYKISGCPSGGSNNTYRLDPRYTTGGVLIPFIDTGNGSVYTSENDITLSIYIYVRSGYTCNNLTFYPMIRKADIEDDTYEPYITNTELDVTLPALSTIKGTNTFSVNTSIQPSNIYIKDGFDYKKVFTATRAIEDESPLNYKSIEDSDSTLKNYRIYGNTVDGESVGDLVATGEHAGEYKVPVTTERSVPHTATLQLHDCLPSAMQFDAPEALYYAENGLTAGTYCFTIQNYDTTYGGGKTYNFTLTNDVPVGGQLTFGWKYNTQAADAKVSSYSSSTSTTAIEQVGVTEGSGGTSLGTTDGNSTNVNHIQRVRYGSNNYKESAIRQFLNSSAVAGSVWTPQTKYDRPPSWNSNTAGFMKDIDSDFLAVLGASPKVVALNTVTDGGDSVTINNDKFFLLSRSEVYGGKENNINEGEPYPYYSNYSDLSAAGTGDDSNRIKYRSGTAQVWWLRSPNSAGGGNGRYVNTSGHVYDGNNANGSGGVAPACNIALDEDYKFNGRVLHVRDQISVQKGNQTLVFDVIGIDHDEVHFDKTTVDIYLTEQIKKVGDEAEYIDYAEQKQHRVRKNLLQNTATSQTINGVAFTVNNDGSVTCNGTASDIVIYVISSKAFSLPVGRYKLNGAPTGGGQNYNFKLDVRVSTNSYYPDTGNGINFNILQGEPITLCRIVIYSGYTCNNLTFYPMIRKADTQDNTYEPYIENTELDVTLPALPVLTGTNTLTVGTEVQPSDIYLKGKIKKKPKIYYKIYYYSQDGQTALSTETVEEGHDCTYSTVPTKESDTDFDYTFTGWSTTTNSTTATAGATENIQQNTNLYAAFSKSFKTDTISDSWEEIIANCDNGTYASKYQIGDLKTIDVGTEGPVQMQIVAIDTDLLASDNTQTAPITWISKQLLNTSAAMNSTATNYLSDWTNCDMRTYLKNTILPMLPSIVQNNIKEVTKYTNQRTGSTTFTTISSTEDIWLPSYREVSNDTSYCETSGVQYNSIFTDHASRVKSKVGNSADYWWTRSASGYSNSDYSYCFAYVYSGGYAHYTGYYCTSSLGAAIGFCT